MGIYEQENSCILQANITLVNSFRTGNMCSGMARMQGKSNSPLHNASKYLAQLHQTLDNHALPYQTTVKVVQAFSNGRVLTAKVISECFTSVHTDKSVAKPEW